MTASRPVNADSPAAPAPAFEGNDRLLFGLVLGLITFWLFAQTMLNLSPDMQRDLGTAAGTMNVAVSLTSLFSGIFTVVMGGLADRLGRMRIVRLGFVLSIVGSLLVALTPSGALAAPVLLLGRAIQGLSAACIMPAGLALIKTWWSGAGRQRAVSMWSIGSWGASGLCALFGGLVAAQFGWRAIFFASIAVALLGLWMLRGAPESQAEGRGDRRFDLAGVLLFMLAMLALEMLVTQGGKFGWLSGATLGLVAATVVLGALFIRLETRKDRHNFLDFSLFSNRTFSGTVLSNFLLNSAAGTLLVTLQLVQLGGGMSAHEAGLLTLGYAIAIIAFIRVGEKLLQRFGPRQPMLWGCLITGLAIALLSPAHLLLEQYRVLAVVGYTLFGIGLAFYATPSTDAALSSLPAAQAGSGAGIYKMSSSLGSGLGVAVSGSIFSGVAAGGAPWLAQLLPFDGRQDNLALREAAMLALGFNFVMVLLAGLVVLLAVPKGKPET